MVDSVLLVSNTSSTMQIISGLFVSQPISRIVPAQSCTEARRSLLESEFDLVIIDTPLPDEFGDDFALHAAESSGSGVVILVDGIRLEDFGCIFEDSGIFALPKPVSPEVFLQAVKLLIASRRQVQRVEAENRKLLQKIEELRMVSRAKCVLIQTLKMTEAQAHRYIEKQSMDLRLTRTAVAENVLRTYER
ncbi:MULTISPECIES: ANTAR domain-containing response regulator [Treponema]|uniref:ANTAR domain protein n=1 Tax=Treponema saccharophilum DSM 2985 TaxID=907348 RepID=H7EKU0_9SPIR|nr:MULTISPECIES: ANTAR domain-containing protein [Treponema]EIC01848.1 ANTAR domain protein [Treponema saccharophilum DSM 2985]BDC96765.1 response regulator [Treponema saccharophilum]